MGTRRQLSVRKSSRTTILIMKVSIIFLAFFVGASYQQGYYWPYPAPYYQPMYNPYQFGFPAPMAPQQISQGRTKVSASDDTAERNVADDGARLFGNNVIFTFNNLLASTSTATVTTFATVSSTATSASVVSCIPSNQFLSNTACRRRRAIFEDSGLEDHIAPSKKEEVEASAIPVEEVKREEVEPEILSSHSETVDGSAVADHVIQKRFAITTITTATVSSTVTSVSFTSTTFTSTLNIGSTTSVLTPCRSASLLAKKMIT